MDDDSLGKVIPSWLGCPMCQGSLGQQESAFTCPSHNLSFPEVNGILRLLPPEKVVEADASAIAYRQQRDNQGWRRLSVDEMMALPEKGPTDWDSLYWQVRRQSFRQLINWFKISGRQGKTHRIVDMGAGIGWLAARFAADDHDVVALDLSDDDAYGLGAARRLKQALNLNLALVQGVIEDPPFQRQQVDLLVYNASLHYAPDINYCLASGVNLLRPGGALIIMDSPVVDKEPVPNWHWGGGRKLEKGQLLAALQGAGLIYKYVTIQRTIRWRLRQLKKRLKGDLPFDFPLIIASLA